MTFEEYWVEVEKLKALPNTAIRQLPSSSLRDYQETVDETEARSDS